MPSGGGSTTGALGAAGLDAALAALAAAAPFIAPKNLSISSGDTSSETIFCRTAPSGSILSIFSYFAKRMASNGVSVGAFGAAGAAPPAGAAPGLKKDSISAGLKPSLIIFCLTAPSGSIFCILAYLAKRSSTTAGAAGGAGGGGGGVAPPAAGAAPATIGGPFVKNESISVWLKPSVIIFCRTAPSGSIFCIFTNLAKRSSGTGSAVAAGAAAGAAPATIGGPLVKKESTSAGVKPSEDIFCRTAPSGNIFCILTYFA